MGLPRGFKMRHRLILTQHLGFVTVRKFSRHVTKFFGVVIKKLFLERFYVTNITPRVYPVYPWVYIRLRGPSQINSPSLGFLYSSSFRISPRDRSFQASDLSRHLFEQRRMKTSVRPYGSVRKRAKSIGRYDSAIR